MAWTPIATDHAIGVHRDFATAKPTRGTATNMKTGTTTSAAEMSDGHSLGI